MIGEYTAEEEEHLRDCWTCSADVNHLETALWLFQSSTKEWSRQNSPAFHGVWSAKETRRGFGARPLRWTLAGLMLALLLGIRIETIRENRQQEADAVQIDTALLEQVNAGVSRAVPATMEPLASLVSWGSSSSETTGSPQTSR
jgi:hypothetical protein